MRNGFCIGVISLLGLVIAAGAWKFLVQGSVEDAGDGRQAIVLNAAERDLVLAEMRGFLVAVQQIAAGIADEDLAQVSLSARQVGAAAQSGMPGSLVGKLPLAFKTMGRDTHRRFDQLALDAEQLGDGQHALGQLSVLMENCVACHATYRFTLDESR